MKSETSLNSLAQQYVDLALCKSKYDYWDVYWYADRPFWRRTAMDYTREYKVYPYVDPGAKREGRTLAGIAKDSDLLIDQLELYRETAGEHELDRVNYLIDHVISLRTRVSVLQGEGISFNNMTDGCYSLIAPPFDLARMDEMHRELTNALPGSGPLAQRIKTFRDGIAIPRQRLQHILTAVTEAFHQFALQNLSVSQNTKPRLKFRELGGHLPFLTLLFGYDYNHIDMERCMALDYPYTVYSMMELIGHEMEPGHLTYFEMRLKSMIDTGYPEMQIIAQYSPSSAFSEGAARRAVHLCFDNDILRMVDFERDVIFAPAGLDKGLCSCMPLWHQYQELLGYFKLEVSRNIWDGVWSPKEAGVWLERYSLAENGCGARLLETLPQDDGHFVSHDYARDVMRDYLQCTAQDIRGQWRLYQDLCKSHMSMRGIKNHTYRV